MSFQPRAGKILLSWFLVDEAALPFTSWAARSASLRPARGFAWLLGHTERLNGKSENQLHENRGPFGNLI